MTFRSERGQVGHRYPEEWALGTPEEDLLRRDFTINALLLDLNSREILDLVGGMEDIRRKRVVCIGRAKERFHEDALRMLRAFRFSAQLGFDLEAGTEAALSEQLSLLQNISRERIAKELEAFFKADYLHKIWETFVDSGMAKQLMPHLPWKETSYRSFLKDIWTKSQKREKDLPSETSLFLFRLAVLHLPILPLKTGAEAGTEAKAETGAGKGTEQEKK